MKQKSTNERERLDRLLGFIQRNSIYGMSTIKIDISGILTVAQREVRKFPWVTEELASTYDGLISDVLAKQIMSERSCILHACVINDSTQATI